MPIPETSTVKLDLLVPKDGSIYTAAGITWHFNLHAESWKQSIVRSPVLFGLPSSNNTANPLLNIPKAFTLDLGMLQETWEINGVIDDNESDATYASYFDLKAIARVAGSGASGTPTEQSSSASPAAGAGVRLTVLADQASSAETIPGMVMLFECTRTGGEQWMTYILRIGVIKWSLTMGDL